MLICVDLDLYIVAEPGKTVWEGLIANRKKKLLTTIKKIYYQIINNIKLRTCSKEKKKIRTNKREIK